MNPGVKKLWLAELRSGKHLQGRGEICNYVGEEGFEFCCLGVLGCKVLKKNPDETDDWVDGGMLDNAHRADVGLTEIEQNALATLNDGGKIADMGVLIGALLVSWGAVVDGIVKVHSFEEIADIVEKYL